MIAGHFQQVRRGPRAGDGAEPAIVGVQGVEEREPGPGPSTMATATAWLSVTIGLAASRSSSWYSPNDLRPVVSSARSASACTAAIAA